MVSFQEGSHAEMHFRIVEVMLSFVMSFIGGLTAIGTMNFRRRYCSEATRPIARRVCILLTGIAMGGQGIWAMHFTGMTGVYFVICDANPCTDAERADPTKIFSDIKYEAGHTIASFLAVVAFMSAGFALAACDHYYQEASNADAVNKAVHKMAKKVVQGQGLKVDRSGRSTWFTVLCRGLHFVAASGVLSGLGVVCMHFQGMVGQNMPVKAVYNVYLIVVITVAGCLVATIAFWIFVRLLVFKASWNWFMEPVSAAIMAAAVMAVHYPGMLVPTYTWSPTAVTDAENLSDESIRLIQLALMSTCWAISQWCYRETQSVFLVKKKKTAPTTVNGTAGATHTYEAASATSSK